MRIHHIPSILLATALLAPLGAQIVVPPAAATSTGGVRGGLPFTYGNYVRHQQAVTPQYLNVGLVYGISFRSLTATNSNPERQWQGMRVILADLTAASVSAMGTNFDLNLGANKQTVFDGRFNIYRPYISGAGDPLEFTVTIPFDAPFLVTNAAPIVVDLMPNKDGTELFPGCAGGGNGATMDYSADAGLYSMAGKGNCGVGPVTGTPAAGGFVIQFHYAPMLLPFGKSCRGSLAVAPAIGSTGSSTLGLPFSFDLTGGAAAGTVAALVIGLSNTTDAAVTLPFSLSGIGATPASNCWQNSSSQLAYLLPMVGGQATLALVWPNMPALKGLEVFSQFAVDDPAISGFSVTQGGVCRLY